MATRAYDYITSYFIDKKYGGLFWSLNHLGEPLDKKKQVYAQAFGIYALSEYYKCKPIQEVLTQAVSLFEMLLDYAHDKKYSGFFEAFTLDWKPLPDQRLSEKDENAPKSMNTHLHLLEAFTNLYRVWPDKKLALHIENLLDDFQNHISNRENNTMHLFFENDWMVIGDVVSFGHDIEASWLLHEAAEVLDNESWIKKTSQVSINMVEAASKGLDEDGGLWYEASSDMKRWIYEKHWWPQAEAMVGFFNAYHLSGDEKYLEQSLNCWRFVKKFIKDNKNGEWFWGVQKDYSIMQKDKAGFWKCPYHNARACMEIIKKISLLTIK